MSDKPVTLEALSAVDKKAEKEAKKKAAAEKLAAKKAAKAAAAGKGDNESSLTAANISLSDIVDVTDEQATAKLTMEQQRVAANRAVTGVLASTAAARDVKFDSFSVAVGGRRSLVASPKRG